MLASLETLDRHIASLARDSDAAEPARLEQKLTALADPPGAESEARRRMRRLLEEQLELARGLTRQLKAAEEQRAHLADVLKTLWLQLVSLRAHQDEAAFDTGEISGRIRAVAEDARRYLEASDQVGRLLESS